MPPTIKDNILSVSNWTRRMKGETPSFWKKIRNTALTIGAVGVAIISLPASIVVIPATIVTIAGYMVAIGAVGTALSQATVKDNPTP